MLFKICRIFFRKKCFLFLQWNSVVKVVVLHPISLYRQKHWNILQKIIFSSSTVESHTGLDWYEGVILVNYPFNYFVIIGLSWEGFLFSVSLLQKMLVSVRKVWSAPPESSSLNTHLHSHPTALRRWSFVVSWISVRLPLQTTPPWTLWWISFASLVCASVLSLTMGKSLVCLLSFTAPTSYFWVCPWFAYIRNVIRHINSGKPNIIICSCLPTGVYWASSPKKTFWNTWPRWPTETLTLFSSTEVPNGLLWNTSQFEITHWAENTSLAKWFALQNCQYWISVHSHCESICRVLLVQALQLQDGEPSAAFYALQQIA